MATADANIPNRAVFESILECAITNSQTAFEAAKNLDFFKCEARDIASFGSECAMRLCHHFVEIRRKENIAKIN